MLGRVVVLYKKVKEMVEQEISTRMVVRVEALRAVEKAILPAFCEEMTCDNTCPMWVEKDCPRVDLACVWCKTTRALTELENEVAKAKYLNGL